MAQTPTVAKPVPNTKRAAARPQARLILQDPLAFDQASQPALRASTELSIEPAAAGLEREKARDLWESLSLEPELAQERQSERKRLLLRSENLGRESAAAKAQAVELQSQLAKARDERLDHPLVYAGAAGLLGLGALWLIERRKRIALQRRELEPPAGEPPPVNAALAAKTAHRTADHLFYESQQGTTFSLEDSPDLARDFATDLLGEPDPQAQQTQAINANVPTEKVFVLPVVPAPVAPQIRAQEVLARAEREVLPTPDWAQRKSLQTRSEADLLAERSNHPQDAENGKPATRLISMSKRVLGNMLSRRSQRKQTDAPLASQLPTEISSASHQSTSQSSAFLHGHLDDATQMLYDEEAQEAFEQELLAQQLNAGLRAGYDPHRNNVQLLVQTRITPLQGETAMEHLLELRTAVSGLCALGRPQAAVKLLEEHIAADPSTCAWAYLEHMHVCEQIGLRDDFELMRKSYRQQFNRMAPYWNEPNSNVLGLDGYSRAAGELCAAWSQGASHAHSTLAAWLVGPVLGRKLMQLPAFHDLFDLYEMLEFVDMQSGVSQGRGKLTAPSFALAQSDGLLGAMFPMSQEAAIEQDFVPTVSLLDLDYEFSSDVTLQEKEVRQSETAITIVKTGNFSVDFNVAGTQIGALSSVPADLAKK